MKHDDWDMKLATQPSAVISADDAAPCGPVWPRFVQRLTDEGTCCLVNGSHYLSRADALECGAVLRFGR